MRSLTLGAAQQVRTAWLQASLLTVLTCLGAQLAAPLPFTPVPVTMQVFVVLLSGLLLGSRWGMVAQAQYLALGLLGAPVFAFGRGGPEVLFWPNVTAGYLLSYPLAAYLVGKIAEQGRAGQTEEPPVRQMFWAAAAGLGVIYTSGCVWLALISRPMLSLPAALLAGAGWFLFWDAVKAAGAVMIAARLRR